MRNLCVMIARLSLSAWVGAAVLFVATAIAEVRSPELSSEVKSTLALLRFPYYYTFGFVLVTTALVFGTALWGYAGVGKRRAGITLGLLAAALLLMTADYVWVYRPLVEMLNDPDTARPASFQTYHTASMSLNAVDLALSVAAAVVLCWPAGTQDR